LRSSRRTYGALIAVGDVYALAMARHARTPLLFVGTAKSDYVSPYGPLERAFIRRAARAFVRDELTAANLRRFGIAAEAANVIADLALASESYPWPPGERIVLLPGSREEAYEDADLLCAVVRALRRAGREVHAVLSVAPGLDEARMSATTAGEPAIPIWRGEVGALFAGATLVVGQAGTANEAAAAAGLPVVALETHRSRRAGWYRMRQARLLGAALEIVPGDEAEAARGLARLLDDPARRAAMGATGRERMGPPGAAAKIAHRIAELASAPPRPPGAGALGASCAS
jgi:tetraacyldisaccharide 4'-kinase